MRVEASMPTILEQIFGKTKKKQDPARTPRFGKTLPSGQTVVDARELLADEHVRKLLRAFANEGRLGR
jgi:hypothetical protein